jgi:hypothetical protein
MKKKKQTKPKDIGTRAEKEQRGKAAVVTDDGWERLLKLREKLRKTADTNDETIKRLEKLGQAVSKSWQSEKSAVEILSEMRR